MVTGIRATVAFSTPGACPVVDTSLPEGVTIDDAISNVSGPNQTGGATEFSISDELGLDEDLQPVFAGGESYWYRLERDGNVNCPCECLGQLGIPVVRYSARDGTLTIVFHAVDYEELKAVVAELRERFPDIDIRRFVRSTTGERVRDSVFVDRGKLTARQLEVLRAAMDMGYFDRPRRANATEVAAELDINASTFSEHLTTVQRKLFEDVLER